MPKPLIFLIISTFFFNVVYGNSAFKLSKNQCIAVTVITKHSDFCHSHDAPFSDACPVESEFPADCPSSNDKLSDDYDPDSLQLKAFENFNVQVNERSCIVSPYYLSRCTNVVFDTLSPPPDVI